MECIRLHPAVDLDNSLDNNVAILRLTVDPPANPPANPPAGVKLRGIVDPRSVVDNFHNKKEATGCSSCPRVSILQEMFGVQVA